MKKNSGFTLMELIIVIGVLSVLSALMISVINPLDQMQKANDSKRKNELNQMQKALEEFYQDNGSYPENSVSPDPQYRIKNFQKQVVEWGGDFSPYMSFLPKDPVGGKSYVYYSTGQAYWLYATLERGAKDPQACNNGAECTSIAGNSIPGNSCGGPCNYGVTSPNVSL